MSKQQNSKLITRKGIGAPPALTQSNVKQSMVSGKNNYLGKPGEQAKIVNIMFSSDIPVPAGLGNGPNNGANIFANGSEAL